MPKWFQSSLRLRSRGAAAACIAFLGWLRPATALRAQELQPTPGPAPATRAAYRVVIDFLSGSIDVRAPNGTLTQSWSGSTRATGRAPLAEIPIASPVDVEVVHANPLLYQYDLQTTVVGRKSLPSCTTLGSRLASSGFLTSFATVATIAQPVLSQGMGQLFQAPAGPGEAMTRGTSLVSTTMLTSALAEHRAGVERYLNFLGGVRRLSISLDDSLAIVGELAEAQPADSLLDGLVRSLEHSYPGLSQSVRVSLTIREQQEAARMHLEALTGLAIAIERGNYDGDAAVGPGAEIVRLTLAVRAAQDSAALSYRALRAQLLRIERARAQTRQIFSTDASVDVRRLTLDVRPTAEYPDVIRSRTGRYEVYTDPTVSLLCQVSVGVAFMDRATEFVVRDGVIERRQTDQRTGVAVTLHVATPRVPMLGALAGFGFGNDGAPDLFAGGSLRFLDPLMLNVGVVWQRAQRLPPGFTEGQAPPEVERMSDLPRGYRGSFFWGLSIAR